jgi:hypothetical protein
MTHFRDIFSTAQQLLEIVRHRASSNLTAIPSTGVLLGALLIYIFLHKVYIYIFVWGLNVWRVGIIYFLVHCFSTPRHGEMSSCIVSDVLSFWVCLEDVNCRIFGHCSLLRDFTCTYRITCVAVKFPCASQVSFLSYFCTVLFSFRRKGAFFLSFVSVGNGILRCP